MALGHLMDISPHEDFYGSLKYLASMGFTDIQLNKRALYHTNGNVQQAIEFITDPNLFEPKDAAPKANQGPQYLFPKLSEDQAAKVLQIAQLGFTDEGKIRHALFLQDWDVEQAVDRLLDADSALRSDFSAQTTTQVGPPQTAHPTIPAFPDADPFLHNDPFASLHHTTAPSLPSRPPAADPYSAFRQPHQSHVFQSHSSLPTQAEVATNPFEDPRSDYQSVQEFDPFADSNKI
jgi:hypothetical protein